MRFIIVSIVDHNKDSMTPMDTITQDTHQRPVTGRPKQVPVFDRTRIAFYVSTRVSRRFKAAAALRGMSVGKLTIAAVDEYLDRHPTEDEESNVK